jgi:hypothetical protein
VVDGAVVEVDASVVAGAVVAGSVDVVDVGRVGGAMVGGAVVEVGASVVVGGLVVGSVGGVVEVVVGACVVEVGAGVVVVVEGVVVVVEELLSWASWVMRRRTAAAWVYCGLIVVVVGNSVEGGVAVSELLLETAFAISRPAITSTPPTRAGIRIWAHRGSARKRCMRPGLSAPSGLSPSLV